MWAHKGAKKTKNVLLFSSFLLLTSSLHGETLKILVSSSMLGKDSFGEFLESEFSKICADCKVQLKTTNEMSSLLGRLRLAQKNPSSIDFDAVMGLDFKDYKIAESEKLVKEGLAYDQSPLSLIADTQKFPADQWPQSWKELSTKLKKNILIGDPRLSSPGFVWLRSVFSLKLQSLESAKDTLLRVYPSWSSSYSAFTKGEGKAVWSYQSSEAYHRCNEKTEAQKKRYLAIPLQEGYPLQLEYLAILSQSKSPLIGKFKDFLVSEKVQQKIPTTNWMFPIKKGIKLPDCFKDLTPIKTNITESIFTQADITQWLDKWAL